MLELQILARNRFCMAERLSEVIASFVPRLQGRTFANPEFSNLRKILHMQMNQSYSTPIFAVNYMVRTVPPNFRMVELIFQDHDLITESFVLRSNEY